MFHADALGYAKGKCMPRAAVGGLGGEVRGRSRREAWRKFEQYIRPQVVEQYGLFLQGPLTEEDAYRSMRYGPLYGTWVLGYYFSERGLELRAVSGAEMSEV
jgi:hypothetical protein